MTESYIFKINYFKIYEKKKHRLILFILVLYFSVRKNNSKQVKIYLKNILKFEEYDRLYNISLSLYLSIIFLSITVQLYLLNDQYLLSIHISLYITVQFSCHSNACFSIDYFLCITVQFSILFLLLKCSISMNDCFT